jgi:hypothetical protein
VLGDAAREANVDYPPGEEQRFAFATQPIRVYGGEVTFAVRVPSPPPKGQPLRMNLTYQACDDSACLPPVTKQLEVAGVTTE